MAAQEQKWRKKGESAREQLREAKGQKQRKIAIFVIYG